MKKLYLLSILLFTLLSPKSVLAQETQAAIKLGVNFASLSGDDVKSLDGRTGIHAGLLYNYVYDDRIALEAGALYSQKGAESKNDSASFKLNYIDIPLLFKYNINRYFNVHAGVQISYLISAENGVGTDIESVLKSNDIAAAFGAEYRFDFDMAFSLRYVAGLKSISGNRESSIFSKDVLDIKNNTLQISTSYYF